MRPKLLILFTLIFSFLLCSLTFATENIKEQDYIIQDCSLSSPNQSSITPVVATGSIKTTNISKNLKNKYPSQNLFPKIFWNGDSSSMKIALTFDDGPKEEESPAILEILDQFGIKATFFIVGKAAEKNPDLVYRIYASGHEIANHTYSHTRLDTISNSAVETEIQKTNQILENITSVKTRYFRPPGGRFNRGILTQVKKCNLDVILWNVNAGDYIATDSPFVVKGEIYSKDADRIYHDVMKRMKKGSIVLFHNGGKDTVKSLPQIISDLEKKGYKFVTLTELLYPKNVQKPRLDVSCVHNNRTDAIYRVSTPNRTPM